jgi:hypothetical protein
MACNGTRVAPCARTELSAGRVPSVIREAISMQSACNYHAPKLSPIERGKGAFGALVIRAYKVEGGHL